MSQLIRYSHGFIRRNLDVIERMLLAAALSGLLLAWMRMVPAYPPFWDVVLAGVVFVAALWSPPVSYFLAILAAAYPVYQVSLYLAVLFLAAALLGQRIILNNLGAALLTVAAPLLSPFWLPWAVPVLGGLWWGTTAGAVMGGLAALWGQALAGMTGADLDWLARLGGAVQGAGMVGRFAGADSLDTLWLLAEPFFPDSTVLLYFLLQIVLWAVVGGVVGSLAERDWAQRRRPWASILLAWASITCLVAGHLLIAAWLGIYTPDRLTVMGRPLLLSAGLPALVVTGLELLRNLVEHPLPRIARKKPAFPAAPESPSTPPLHPVPYDSGGKIPDDEDKDDLIMLELE